MTSILVSDIVLTRKLVTQKGVSEMDRNEILAQSRKENKNKDLAELEAVKKASNIASRVGMLVCCLIAVLEVIFTSRVNYASWTIYFSILGTLFLVKYLSLRKRHELLMTILCLALFVFFFTLYLLRIAGVV